MAVKRKPHHDLAAIQAKFADVDTLEITGKATRDAQALGYTLENVVDVVQALETGDFVGRKPRIAHQIRGSGTTPITSHATACSCI